MEKLPEGTKCPMCKSTNIQMKTKNLISEGGCWSEISTVKCYSCDYAASALTEAEAFHLFKRNSTKK